MGGRGAFDSSDSATRSPISGTVLDSPTGQLENKCTRTHIGKHV